MDMEKPRTPEEIARLKKSRTISDGELLEKGGEYIVDEEGKKIDLVVTDKQKKSAHGFFKDKEREKFVGKLSKEEEKEKSTEAATLFVKEMKSQIQERLSARDFRFVMAHLFGGGTREGKIQRKSELSPEQLRFLEELIKVYETSKLDHFLNDGMGCRDCFIRAIERGGDRELAMDIAIGGDLSWAS